MNGKCRKLFALLGCRKSITMNENDSRPKTDNLALLESKGIPTDDEDDDDIHYCKKCQEVFKSIETYLEHKVKHDNFKVIYSRSNRDRRVVLPKLIPRVTRVKKSIPTEDESTSLLAEGNENRQKKKQKRRSDIDVTHIIERSTYICNICDKKFNREATLRWHMKYDHELKKSEEDDDDGEDDNEEAEYVPEKGVEEINDEDQDETHTRQFTKRQKLSEEELSLRPFTCETCNSKFRDLQVLKVHQLTHNSIREYPCTVEDCPYCFKTKGSLKRHMRRHTGERPYECTKCKRKFAESGALTRHNKSRTLCTEKTDADLPRYGKQWKAEQNVAVKVGALSNMVPKLEIGTSTLDLEQEVELGEIDGDSQIVGGNETIQADLDAETTDELVHITLDKLSEIEIENLEPTQCRVCKEDLMTFENLKLHLRVHLADMPYRCSSCHFVAESMDELNSHMITVHQKPLKGFDDLQNKFTNSIIAATASPEEEQRMAQIAVRQLLEIPGALEPEDLTIEGADRNAYKCPACQRTFRGSSYLKQHMKSHAGVKPNKCSICEKCFTTKDALTKHLTVHSDERQFKCGECGRLFKRLSHIRTHLQIHSTDRPFTCEICSKSFKTRNAVKVHLRTHNNVLPYQCRFCERFFREKSSLQRHIRMHTGERPYKCQHCNRGFSEQGTLCRHLKAKVPCTKNLYLSRKASLLETYEETEEEIPTVLAEFSSVVADTQQYILEDGTETVDLSDMEYVVVHADVEHSENIQNLEIVADGEIDPAILDQLTNEGSYVVVNEEGNNLRIIDSISGTTIALMPQLHDKLSLPMENEIEAVAMAPISDSDAIQQAMMVANVVDGPIDVGTVEEVQISESSQDRN